MDGKQTVGHWQQHFYLATLVISGFGIVDALAILSDSMQLFSQGYSLVELLWIPACLVAVIAFSKQGKRPWAALIYATYHIFIWWLVSYWGVFEPGFEAYPFWLVASALVLYSVLVVLCWRELKIVAARED